VDGTLYTCLGQEEKFEFSRCCARKISDAALEDAIRDAISLKPERHEFRKSPAKIVAFHVVHRRLIRIESRIDCRRLAMLSAQGRCRDLFSLSRTKSGIAGRYPDFRFFIALGLRFLNL